MTTTHKNQLHKDPLSHPDTKFIKVIYFAPIGLLMNLDKDVIQDSLARAKMICQWLEGILELAEPNGKGE